MLKELVNRVKAEIDEERRERETSQETLLTLLEDTCNKLCSTT
jgi:Ser-tRNA(Ala) deacylase AlaX